MSNESNYPVKANEVLKVVRIDEVMEGKSNKPILLVRKRVVTDVFLDWGYSCTRSKETLRRVLDPILASRESKHVTNQDVADVFVMMAQTYEGLAHRCETEPYNILEQSFSRLSATNGNASSGNKQNQGKPLWMRVIEEAHA